MQAYWLHANDVDGEKDTAWGWVESEEQALLLAKEVFYPEDRYSKHSVEQMVGGGLWL